MTILIADGHDHYGAGATSKTNMLTGAYASTNMTCEVTNPRTGTHALGDASFNLFNNVRRILPGVRDTLGMGYALSIGTLPTTNNSVNLVQWRNGANSAVCSVVLQTTGDIEVKSGTATGTLVAQTSAPIITTSGYQHVEIKTVFAGASGSVEVRVNGVTVINATNVNIGASSTVAQYLIGATNSVTISDFWIDDFYVWDDAGSNNNDFIGDIKLQRLDPTSDTVLTDWVRFDGASDFASIDDADPDGDTTYLTAALAGDTSEFGMTDTPILADTIKFIATYASAKKTDAGSAVMQIGIGSSDIGSPPAPAQVLGTAHSVTEAYAYYQDVFEVDPATNAPFTPAAVDAARLILERQT